MRFLIIAILGIGFFLASGRHVAAATEEFCSFEKPRGFFAIFDQPPKPKIAIVIDDMGVDYVRSMRALELPSAVTMSYLPYGRKLQEQVKIAKQEGHEVILHLPMEAENKSADPGPDYLGTDMPVEEIERRLKKNLSSFSGYEGVNNHMGSKFSQDKEKLTAVMRVLKERQIYFLDSRTASNSKAEIAAKEVGVRTAGRDVFIDDENSDKFAQDALQKIERIARKKGLAIAIGHPRDVTLKELARWIPTLDGKGLELIPLKRAIDECNKETP